MIKNIVHYVGFLMLLVFMTGFTLSAANAGNSLNNNAELANQGNPNITENEISIVDPRPETELQLFLLLFRQTNICQATMVNLGKVFSVSLATIKNIDPNLPVVAQLETLIGLAQQRYAQLTQMEGGMVQKLRSLGVDDTVLGSMGSQQFNESINYGMRIFGSAHASPLAVEGFIATLLQQNIACEGGITDSLEKIKQLNAPPSLPKPAP